MGFGDWLRRIGRTRREGRRDGSAPKLEALEPRLLLNADWAGTVSLPPAEPPCVAPVLEDLELIDQDPARFDGQVVYLDFDGASHVVFDGPVQIGPFDVAGFKAPANLAGQEQAIAESVLDNLKDVFEGSGVVFVTTAPEVGTEYSTVYVGGDDTAFGARGVYAGLAEQVDVSNQDGSDVAFVFSENIGRGASSAASLASQLAQVIAHEAGHLLGYAHSGSAGGASANGPLDAVAQFTGPDDGQSAANHGPVHQWLTYNAYLFYDSQYAGSEMSQYIGDWTDYGSNHHRSNGDDNDVIEGAFDEDVSAPITYFFDDGFHWDIVPQNPLGQDITYYNHFVAGGDGDELYIGWSDHTSAVVQATDYWQDYVLDSYATDPALSYYYLGHVAHLLEDMSTPAHVHNDEHPVRDAYEYTMGEHSNYLLWGYGEDMRNQPSGSIGLPADLTSLFQVTIDYTEEYPSNDATGDDEAGIENVGRHRPDLVSRSGGFTGDGATLDALSYNEITIIADDLMPWAMEQVASLYRLFYAYIDVTAPTVSFTTSFGETEETAVPKPDQFDVIALATDDASGYDADGFRFTVERKQGDSWQPVATGTSAGAFAFSADVDGVYRVYVEIEDAVGNVGRSATGYFYTDQTQPLSPVYRFWSPVLTRHFYTISESERDYVMETWPDAWTYEGPAFYAYTDASGPEGTSPVYRFWSPQNRAHFYTADEAEKDAIIAYYPPEAWTYEGIAYYAYRVGSSPQGASPVYRFWSPTLRCHFYTISQQERDLVLDLFSHAWTYEGTVWDAYAL